MLCNTILTSFKLKLCSSVSITLKCLQNDYLDISIKNLSRTTNTLNTIPQKWPQKAMSLTKASLQDIALPHDPPRVWCLIAKQWDDSPALLSLRTRFLWSNFGHPRYGHQSYLSEASQFQHHFRYATGYFFHVFKMKNTQEVRIPINLFLKATVRARDTAQLSGQHKVLSSISSVKKNNSYTDVHRGKL